MDDYASLTLGKFKDGRLHEKRNASQVQLRDIGIGPGPESGTLSPTMSTMLPPSFSTLQKEKRGIQDE